jgi:hypothetical protein
MSVRRHARYGDADFAHGGHGCIQITSELGTYMLLKQIDHGLLCHDIPQP